jgi:hypothetical protein
LIGTSFFNLTGIISFLGGTIFFFDWVDPGFRELESEGLEVEDFEELYGVLVFIGLDVTVVDIVVLTGTAEL